MRLAAFFESSKEVKKLFYLFFLQFMSKALYLQALQTKNKDKKIY